MEVGDEVQITNVDFGSAAERHGLDFGMQITSVLVPADRWPKELMFIPALMLLGLIAWLQIRRRPQEFAGEPAPATAGED
jgi:hypothetical protein